MTEQLLKSLCLDGFLFVVLAFTYSTYSPYSDSSQKEVLAVILFGAVLFITCWSALVSRNSVRK